MENANKLITNPNGPYKIKLFYRGVDCFVQIKNITETELDIRVKTEKVLEETEMVGLMNYLNEEGFTNEAIKHNLFW
jgi:hypothetical protein